MESRRLAVVDIGTNSVRLTGAEWVEGRPRIGIDLGDVTRLGAGLVARGAIDPSDEARTAGCLVELLARARAAGYADIRIFGTEVFRAATNGAESAARLAALAGVPLQVLTGAEEAEASFLGATSGLATRGGTIAVVDVGGGSTELIVGQRGRIDLNRTLPVGALRVTAAWLHGDPPPPEELAAARNGLAEAFRELAPLAPRVRAADARLGVGGSLCALAAHGGGIAPYDPERVHGRTVTLEGVRSAIIDWGSQPLSERMKRGGMSEGRARVVLGGALAVEAFMAVTGVDEIRVSVNGLRHGLLERLAGAGPVRD